ncbi:MAG: hypothetical protein A2498_13640 [Lentisphaerae bacterium RIFOXYC12_FULL_60_16]|nr:MAG: hypothetical protein A2498_13640 [Lentisphaerae bacterium RIFOXYC12_FULL_60_16]
MFKTMRHISRGLMQSIEHGRINVCARRVLMQLRITSLRKGGGGECVGICKTQYSIVKIIRLAQRNKKGVRMKVLCEKCGYWRMRMFHRRNREWNGRVPHEQVWFRLDQVRSVVLCLLIISLQYRMCYAAFASCG